MKKALKFIALLATFCLMLALVACGGGNNAQGGGNDAQGGGNDVQGGGNDTQGGSNDAQGVDKTYRADYDNTMDDAVLDNIPNYQFNAGDLSFMVSYGQSLEVILDLDADGTYKLTSHWYSQGVDDETSPAYSNFAVEATGTYTIDGDKVTISAAEHATATFDGGSYITEQEMYLAFSFGADGETGTWSSDDVPEILACVPATVFTVADDGTIVTWEPVDPAKAGNPHDGAPGGDAAQGEEPAEGGNPAADDADGLVMTSPEWDVVAMIFYADGTCKFTLDDYGIVEDGTWTYEDGVLTVTAPSGATYSSTTDGDTLKLDYTADASDQIVGKFESTDWQSFFEG